MFADRPGLQRLLREAQAGDVLVCRDQSRLGRDILETGLVLRTLISEKQSKLFYYVDGTEASWRDVTDKVLALVRGIGPEYEREAIRSRTREALRQRARLGRVAGGACFGYANDRRTDESGRKYTVQVVDPEQADLVKRIFSLFVEGNGPRAIAKLLNAEGVPPPRKGRRGTGSWSPSAIHEMLRRDRYRGIVIHGERIRVDRGGRRVMTRAQDGEIIRVERPDLRIVPEELWNAAEQVRRRYTSGSRPSPARRHLLSGVGRCGICGGPMMVANNRDGRVNRPAYACLWHRDRGAAVCSNGLRRPKATVEAVVAEYLLDEVLTEGMVAEVLRRVRDRLGQVQQRGGAGLRRLEAEACKLRCEVARYVEAVGQAPEVTEIVSALRDRRLKLDQVEAEITAARRAPEVVGLQLKRLEREARARVADLRGVLERQPDHARRIVEMLYPSGLRFTPIETPDGKRYQIEGEAVLGECVKLEGVPSGTATLFSDAPHAGPAPLFLCHVSELTEAA